MEHIERKPQKSNATLAICITALFMALNIMMSSFGLPVPGGHLYLNDVIICTAAILLDDPKAAFIVGGVGAFLGDLFFYPTPMFVSLVTHGIQAVVICLLAHRGGKVSFKGAALGVILGAVIMVVGYSLDVPLFTAHRTTLTSNCPTRFCRQQSALSAAWCFASRPVCWSASTKCSANNFLPLTQKLLYVSKRTTAFLFASACSPSLDSRQITALFCCENYSASLNTLPPINSRRIELLGITSSSNGLT